jgi:hypothetical protein
MLDAWYLLKKAFSCDECTISLAVKKTKILLQRVPDIQHGALFANLKPAAHESFLLS